ncbi:hypothetical protein RM533_01730 [Croceicoccus sp. F390]|uniref:Uncharacterized protein n=1 Tax=Croceicoccus esteveae TaxID=3075597 RepID=A0ABU2ZE72_9SPHN|nr:hypothetical protein [Croceicoccus sp. F390]MDT0574900.1 hypothetical protein [Croceicoccus sp. F390]
MSDRKPYSGIAEEETFYFTGPPPLHSGQVTGSTLHYLDAAHLGSPPSDDIAPRRPLSQNIPASQNIPVDQSRVVNRFAGRNGVSFSGTNEEGSFLLAATPGDCRDGSTNNLYPYSVTYQTESEISYGCGWTPSQPFAVAE